MKYNYNSNRNRETTVDWKTIQMPREENLPLYLQLAEMIRNLIEEKKLQPREKLPVSRELQKLFFLSSVTVEKGISRLVEEKYLYRRPRIGTFVSENPPPVRVRSGSVKVVFSKILPFGNFWFNQLYNMERLLRRRNVSMQFLINEEEYSFTADELCDDCRGIIFCGTSPLKLVLQVHARRFPFVVVGSLDGTHPAVKKMDQITGNDVERYYVGMRHLLNLGHRKILAVTAQTGSQYTEQQLAGYRRALREFGLKLSDIAILPLPDVEKNVVPWEELIRNALCAMPLPSAITAFNGIAACTTVRALSRLGLKVPEDISIITYDPWYAELTTPALTTVVLGGDYSKPAVERLFAQMEDPAHRPAQLIIGKETEIRLNESSRFNQQP